MKRQKTHRAWVLAAATAAIGLTWSACRPALAQYRVDNSLGHALDANNRLGSYGYNGPVNYSQSSNSTQNSIYLGTSTGYSGFNGFVPSQKLNQFQGQLPNQPSLQLLQQSGTNSPGAAPTYNQAAPFYSNQNTIYAPPGYNQLVGGVYQAAPPDVRQPQDYRLGSITNSNPAPLLHAGDISGPGQIDPTAYLVPSYLNNTPIFGASALSLEPGALSNSLGSAGVSQGTASRLSPDDIIKLRGELSQSPTPWLNGSQPLPTAEQPAAVPNGAQQPGATPTSPAIPFPGAASVAQPNLSQSAAIATAAPMQTPGVYSTGQSQRNLLLPLPAPEQQSPQYAKLRQLLQQYQSAHPQTDEEANRLFQAALKARREYEQNLGKRVPTVPPAESSPSAPELHGKPSTPPPAPVEIGSIGQGITANGLGQLIMQGEELARHQQYKDAISKFLDARQVAPNNMLITVDLANAELGAGFYQQAEQYLRDAFSSDPATLMARYDVKSVIGDQRLQIVVNDLKQIASSDNTATPIFLLAYLSYNSGEKDKAMEYLKLAQSRAGGQDELIQSLSDHWALPSTQPSR